MTPRTRRRLAGHAVDLTLAAVAIIIGLALLAPSALAIIERMVP